MCPWARTFLEGQVAQDVVDRVGRLGPLDLGVVVGDRDGGLEGEGGRGAAAVTLRVGVGDVLLGGVGGGVEVEEPPERVSALPPVGGGVGLGGGDGGRGRSVLGGGSGLSGGTEEGLGEGHLRRDVEGFGAASIGVGLGR